MRVGRGPNELYKLAWRGATPRPAPLSMTGESEEQRKTTGERRSLVIWEFTQAVIAAAVTIATLCVAARLALKEQEQTAAFLLLSNAFFLVIGVYFERANHKNK